MAQFEKLGLTDALIGDDSTTDGGSSEEAGDEQRHRD
jgi:hypothetical protein